MSGVTNALIESVKMAANQNDSYLQKLETLENRHLETIAGLQLRNVQSSSLSESVVSDFSAIREVLRNVWITALHLLKWARFLKPLCAFQSCHST
jgi:hypothetical protein